MTTIKSTLLMLASTSVMFLTTGCGGGGGGSISPTPPNPPTPPTLTTGSIILSVPSLIPTQVVGESPEQVLFETGVLPASFEAQSLTPNAEFRLTLTETDLSPGCVFSDGSTNLENTVSVSITAINVGECLLELKPSDSSAVIDSVTIRFDSPSNREFGSTIGDVWKHDLSASGAETLGACPSLTADAFGSENLYADEIKFGPLAGNFLCLTEFEVNKSSTEKILGLQEVMYTAVDSNGNGSSQVLASCKTLAESDPGIRKGSDYAFSFVNVPTTRIDTPNQSLCQSGGKSHDTGFRDVIYDKPFVDPQYGYECETCIVFTVNTSMGGGARGDRIVALRKQSDMFYTLEYVSDLL